MKQLLSIVLSVALLATAHAAQKSAEELVVIFEQAVDLAAKGEVSSAVRMMSNESSKPTSPKEMNARRGVSVDI